MGFHVSLGECKGLRLGSWMEGTIVISDWVCGRETDLLCILV